MNRFDLPRLWLRLHGRRWTVVAATVATTLAGTGALLYAHPFAGGTNTDRVSLHGHTVPALAHAKPLRATDGAAALDLDVVLAPRDQAGLDALIAAQNDKHSPLYQHYLTPQQYLDRFGPTQATVDAVQAFLRGQGLLVGGVSPNRLIIHASGSVATVEQAFGVQLNDYQLGGRVVHAPAGDPAVPASLGASIAGIVGLDDVVQLQPHLLRPSGKAPNAVPHAGPGGGYSPTDLRTAYDMNPLESAGIDGTGVTVALFELDGYDPNDIATFLSYYGLGTAKYSNVLVDGATNNSPGAG